MAAASTTTTAGTATASADRINPALKTAIRFRSCDADWHGSGNADCICSGVVWSCSMCQEEHPWYAAWGEITENNLTKAVCADGCMKYVSSSSFMTDE